MQFSGGYKRYDAHILRGQLLRDSFAVCRRQQVWGYHKTKKGNMSARFARSRTTAMCALHQEKVRKQHDVLVAYPMLRWVQRWRKRAHGNRVSSAQYYQTREVAFARQQVLHDSSSSSSGRSWGGQAGISLAGAFTWPGNIVGREVTSILPSFWWVFVGMKQLFFGFTSPSKYVE